MAKATKPNPLPHNAEAELAVLGACLIDPDAAFRIEDLQAEDFQDPRRGAVFAAMLKLTGDAGTFDVVSLADWLERRGELAEVGGMGFLTSLLGQTPTSLHVEHYAAAVHRCAVLRDMIRAAGGIARIAYADDEEPTEEKAAKAEALLLEATRRAVSGEPRRAGAVASEVYDEWAAISEGRAAAGVRTGFADLDAILTIRPGDFAIVAGRPGQGKSSFLLGVAASLARRGEPSLLFSLEMSAEQNIARLLSAEARIDGHAALAGRTHDSDWPLIAAALEKIHAWPLWIDDTPTATVSAIKAKVRRHEAKYGSPALVIVDYLQLLHSGRKYDNRVAEFTQVSGDLKAMFRELRVPGLVASQLSRAVEQRSTREPILSDLRESGSIEQDSDAVIFLYRDSEKDADPGIANVIVAKHRNGPTGALKLQWNARTASFHDLAREM